MFSKTIYHECKNDNVLPESDFSLPNVLSNLLICDTNFWEVVEELVFEDALDDITDIKNITATVMPVFCDILNEVF